MAIEVACPRCGGRLIAEPLALVACPHCRELLTIPSREEAAAARQQAADAAPVEDTGAPTDDEPSFPGLPLAESVSADSFLLAAAAAGGTALAPARAEIVHRSGAPAPEHSQARADNDGSGVLVEAVPAEPIAAAAPPRACEREGTGTLAGPVSRGVEHMGREPVPFLSQAPTPELHAADPPVREEGSVPEGASTAIAQPTPLAAAPLAAAPISRRPAGVPTLYFVLVCSYALLATLVLLLIVFVVPAWLRPHQLESLPDIVPKHDARGEIEVNLYPEEARLPRGHELRLSETGRFGSLEVEPLRVTRGPLELVHFQADVPQDGHFERPATEPVLKLWVRFRNVSSDQVFAPLGPALVFTRGRGKTDRRRRGNNFVAPADARARPRDCVYLFDHAVSGDYDLKDQHVGRGLAPGDEFVTYLPSEEEGLERLRGDLVWRMHVRKGLGPSGWGVTTLVDVRFHSDEIVDE